MGILDKIRGFSRAATVPHASGQYVSGGLADMLGRRSTYSRTQQITEAAKLDIALGLNRVAERVSKHALYVVHCRREKDGRITKVVTETHPGSQLLWRPNAHMTGSDLVYDTAWSRRAWEAFWLIEVNGRGEPSEFWPLRPDYMTEVPDRVDYLKGWLYSPPWAPGGVFIPAERVIHFRRPSKLNPYRGASVIQEQAERVATSEALAVYGRSIVANGGRLDFHLRVDSTDPEEVRKALDIIRAGIGHARKGEGIVATGAGSTLTPLNLKPADLEYIQLAKMTRDSLLVAIGAPPDIVGFHDSTKYASAENGYLAWNRDVIEPELRLMAEAIGHKLLPLYKNHSAGQLQTANEWYEIGFDNPIPEDQEKIERSAREGVQAGLLTINEGRARLGEDPIDGGDDVLVSAGKVPLSLLIAQVKADLETERATSPQTREEGAAGTDPKAEPAPETDDEYAARWVRTLQGPAERRFLRMHRAVAAEQLEEVLANIETHREELERLAGEMAGRYPEANMRRLQRDPTLILALLFDLERWIDRFGAAALPELRRMLERAGAAAAAGFGAVFDTGIARIAAWVRTQAFVHYAGNVNTTTLDQLRATFMEGLAAGETIDSLKRRAEGVYSELGGRRARMAARTESAGALNYGHDEAIEQAKEQGHRLGKRWVAALDERTRPAHAAANGTYADATGHFTVGGHRARYPGDPLLPPGQKINCRCTERAVRLDDKGSPIA